MSIAPQTQITIPPLHQWIAATWADYVALRDAPIEERMRLFFDRGWMWLDMGGEGISHSQVSDLMTMLFLGWAMQHPEQTFNSFGRCLLEKPETQACALDLVLYLGEDYPRWREGEPRRIDLTRWRVPNLVGEIADTTLATDLDEKKHLYEALEISEYWAIDVRGRRIFAFELQSGKYEVCTTSQALSGLPISLLEQAIDRLTEGTNTSAAAWFAQQIQAVE